MRSSWCRLVLGSVVAIVLALGMGDGLWAQNKGGGKGGSGGSDPPPPPASPLRYRLHLSEKLPSNVNLSPVAVNIHGVLVGRAGTVVNNNLVVTEAILYDSQGVLGSGVARCYRLRDIVGLVRVQSPDSEIATFLSELGSSRFTGINDSNQIIGSFRKEDTSPSRLFVVDLSQGMANVSLKLVEPDLSLLGELGLDETKYINQFNWHINNDGIVAMRCANPDDTTPERVVGCLVDINSGFSRVVTYPDPDPDTGLPIPIYEMSNLWIGSNGFSTRYPSSLEVPPSYIVEFDNQPLNLDGEPNIDYLRVTRTQQLIDGDYRASFGLSDQGTTTGVKTVTVQLSRNRTAQEQRYVRLRQDPVQGTFSATELQFVAPWPNRQGDIYFDSSGFTTTFRGGVFMAWDETPFSDQSVVGPVAGPYIDVESLIFATNTADSNFWYDSWRSSAGSIHMANRDGSGYAKLGGRVYNDRTEDRRFFVLVPEVTP